MKSLFATISITLSLSLCCLNNAWAEDTKMPDSKRAPQSGFFYGVMASYNEEIYAGVDNDWLALPVIGYRSEKFSFLGPLVSYQVMESENVLFNAVMKYRFAGYEESDSDDLKGMEDRDASLDLGMDINFKKDKWSAKFGVAHDIIGSSSGIEVVGALGKTFYFGPIFVEPNFSLIYWDNQYVDYYYGVEASEATAVREEYRGEYAVNKKLGVNISTPIFFKGFTRLTLAHTWYDSSVSNSPITDEEANFSARLTFTKFF